MLNLNDFIQEDEKIKFGNDEFVITAEIPAKIIMSFEFEYNSLAEKDITKLAKKEVKCIYDNVISLLKEIFYIKNDKEKINKFVESLSLGNIQRVVAFIFEYIKNANEKKKIN